MVAIEDVREKREKKRKENENLRQSLIEDEEGGEAKERRKSSWEIDEENEEKAKQAYLEDLVSKDPIKKFTTGI